MKTLYIECNMGCAGDMLMGALLEIAPEGMAEKLSALPIPGVTIQEEHRETCGINGTHMAVKVNGEEEDEHMHDHLHVLGHDYDPGVHHSHHSHHSHHH